MPWLIGKLFTTCVSWTPAGHPGIMTVYDYGGRWKKKRKKTLTTRCEARSQTLFKAILGLPLEVDWFNFGTLTVFHIHHQGRLNKHLLIIIVMLSPVINRCQAKQDRLINKCGNFMMWNLQQVAAVSVKRHSLLMLCGYIRIYKAVEMWTTSCGVCWTREENIYAL